MNIGILKYNICYGKESFIKNNDYEYNSKRKLEIAAVQNKMHVEQYENIIEIFNNILYFL